MNVREMSNGMLVQELHNACKIVCVESKMSGRINDVWYQYVVEITNEMNRRYWNGESD